MAYSNNDGALWNGSDSKGRPKMFGNFRGIKIVALPNKENKTTAKSPDWIIREYRPLKDIVEDHIGV